METMAERSVDGTVCLDYPPSGLMWRLTCPATNALEPGTVSEISAEGEKPINSATGKVMLRTMA
jgi:hypothetical protein